MKRIRPSHSLIEQPSDLDHYWNVMLGYWRLPRSIRHFPAANPVSIERSNLAHLREHDFLCALKTDGVRHLLLLTTSPASNEPIALMIDRTNQMYEVEVWASPAYFFEGTLLDGELVWNKERSDALDYVVFDAMRVKGVDCLKLPYRDRLQMLYQTIYVPPRDAVVDEEALAEEDRVVAMNNLYGLRMMPKRCVPKSQLRELWDDQARHIHRNDGLIFTLNHAAVEIGTSTTIYKWKPHHTIDVHVIVGEDGAHELRANDNRSKRLVRLDTYQGRPFALQPNRLLEVLADRLPCIVECVIGATSDGAIALSPERERTDKRAPNTLKVIEATVRNADEQIDVAELAAALAG